MPSVIKILVNLTVEFQFILRINIQKRKPVSMESRLLELVIALRQKQV